MHSDIAGLSDPTAFNRAVKQAQRANWVVYAKPPFAGPRLVLAYLGRYIHRITISNSRLVNVDDGQITFPWKDYRKAGGQKLMTLDAHVFIRRFLHTVPDGFHRIRHFGYRANSHRQQKLHLCRNLFNVPQPEEPVEESDTKRPSLAQRCPCCGGTMTTVGAWIPLRAVCRPAWNDSS